MPGYETSFKRYFMFGGIFCVLLVAVFANFMKEKIAFEKVESEAFSRFKKYKAYKEDVYFPQTQVAGPDGKLVNLLDGKHYTVLNIWATWCAPCVAELPSLKRLQAILAYEQQWRVVAVSIDKNEDIEKIDAFTKKLKVEQVASYIDVNKHLQRAVNIKGLPMTLILDKRGKILYEIYGDVVWYDASVVTLLRKIDWVN